MKQTKLVLFFIISMLLFTGFLYGGGSQEKKAGGEDAESVDYVGIAAVMIRDGNYERAAKALEKVDTSNEALDIKRFYTLSGLLALRQGDNKSAVDAFQRAKDEGQDDPVLNVYLAQAYYGKKQYEDAIEAIEKVSNLTQYPALYGLQADSYWKIDKKAEGYEILNLAIELFPSQTQFLRQEVFYLIELGLTQAAGDRSELYLERLDDEPAAYVTVGEALRRGGNPQQSIVTLEMGLLQHPNNRNIRLALAQAYLDAEKPRTAGSMVERAAAQDQELYFEAAEIFRRAHYFDRALFLNSLVVEESKKAVQRFHVLLSMERYESAVALESRLRRTGNLEDDANRYAMAFGFFKTRQFDRAVEYLNKIESSEYFRRATQLRQAVETVRESEDFS